VKTEKKYCCQRVLYGVKRNIAANEAHFWDCCSNVGHFLCGVARVKRYVNVYLHLYRQQPEMDNQNADFAYPEKNFADACVICVYNLASVLYFAICRIYSSITRTLNFLIENWYMYRHTIRPVLAGTVPV